MLKLVFNIRRRSDVEPEEFYRYWKDEHGPLVRSVAEVQEHEIIPLAG
jgi:hypothetical protein